jgi:preprotein translocase subunit SecA
MNPLAFLQSTRQLVLPAIAAPLAADEQSVERIQDAALALRSVSSEKLRASADQLRLLFGDPKNSPETLIIPAFALMAEAIRRSSGFDLFGVQILAGLALARGAVAEMQTGEGKTLAEALPAFLCGLSGRGVHVVTTNTYLAERDWQQLKPAYELLGASTGLLRERVSSEVKRAAYACDITFGTGYEFGFDYLRDQLSRLARCRPPLGRKIREALGGRSAAGCPSLQRGHAVAIVDEIDSVLIDEACLPLVLSEAATDSTESVPAAAAAYRAAQHVAKNLHEGSDFQLDREAGEVTLTENGLSEVRELWLRQPQTALSRPWVSYIENALRANHLLCHDVDYVRQDERILIVDEFTGRIFADRSWRDGLHQAVEAKEGLPVRAEMKTAARISRQRYFRRYEQLSGTTGTVSPSEKEFWRMYRMSVVAIPLRIPSRREVLPTKYFRDLQSKWQAIVRDIVRLHSLGRPILVGSRTIENSQQLAARVESAQIPFRLLNGRQDLDEALVVAKAGEKGAVTIATNMAGRGTDIRLGPGAAQLGGLHLIGVERHESPRIDRQLMGRVARQGDPGSCQFYVSADDSLLVDHAPHLGREMRHAPGNADELVGDFSTGLSRVQRRAESTAYRARREVLTYDTWLDEVLATLAKD